MSSIHKVTGSMIGYVVSVPQVSLVGESRTPKAFYQVIRNIRWNDPDSGERQERKEQYPWSPGVSGIKRTGPSSYSTIAWDTSPSPRS